MTEEILLRSAGKMTRQKVSGEIIDQIKAGVATVARSRRKPGELLKPISFELEGRDG